MTAQDAIQTQSEKHRITVEEFFLLDQSGAFRDFAKAELIDGEIYTMNAQHRPHGMAKMDLYDALRDALRKIGSPLRPVLEITLDLGEHGAPEPDITLTSEPYGEGPIPVETVALVIEISDHTLAMDLGKKAELYASAGIPEYWVVDVEASSVHQFWSPNDERYDERRETAFDGTIEAVTVAGLSLLVD